MDKCLDIVGHFTENVLFAPIIVISKSSTRKINHKCQGVFFPLLQIKDTKVSRQKPEYRKKCSSLFKFFNLIYEKMKETIESEEMRIKRKISSIVGESKSLLSEILISLEQIRKPDEATNNGKPDNFDLLNNLENLVLLNNSYLIQSIDALERMNQLTNENFIYRENIIVLDARCKNLEESTIKLEKQIKNITNAKSYRFSRACVEAIKKPGKNTLAFPYRLFKIFSSR